MIALDDVVLRDDLDPRLGYRDDDLIEQYADIFDALPPIEVNQGNEVIDGWHRYLAAIRVGVAKIACVVVETRDDDDLADRMWQSNLRHGVQYTRDQRKTRGLKLYARKLSASEIADRVGVSPATVRRWTKEQRERDKEQRNDLVIELAQEGKTQAEIAEETGVPQRTVSDILSENVRMRETAKEAEALENTAVEPKLETAPADEAEPNEQPVEDTEPESDTGDEPAEETPEPELEVAPDEEIPDFELEVSSPPEQIPPDILQGARVVMGAFAESRPEGYVARFEASPSEWMTDNRWLAIP